MTYPVEKRVREVVRRRSCGGRLGSCWRSLAPRLSSRYNTGMYDVGAIFRSRSGTTPSSSLLPARDQYGVLLLAEVATPTVIL